MKNRTLTYEESGSLFEAFIAFPPEKKPPLVLLSHAWAGRDDFICKKAEEMANWGYVGFAWDLYGKGVIGASSEENAALKKPLLEDRALLKRRLLKSYETALLLPNVDHSKIAVIGYGFGGLCALDLARYGVPLKGAVSVYGHFDAPKKTKTSPVKAKILILHGADDPISTKEEVAVFEREMQAEGVNIKVHLFDHTLHAFMNPSLHVPEKGLAYNPSAAKRSDELMALFLKEIFS